MMLIPESTFRNAARGLASWFPPAARLVAEWDDLRRRCRALENRCRHLEAEKGESDRPIMERARRNFELGCAAGADLPDPGPRWQVYAEMTRDLMGRFREPIEAILFAQEPGSHGGFETRKAAALLPELAAAEEVRLGSAFPAFANTLNLWSESIYSDPATSASYNGRTVSSPMYLVMSYFMQCLSRLPKAPDVVCEIGGGYGSPARLWMTNPIHRPRQYIIVDLPESLFFSELYLVKHFGVEQVVYISDRSATTVSKIARAPVVLCPNGFIDMLAPLSIGLAINANSLQEMPEAYVDFFMSWLDRQDCRFFFSNNFALQDLRSLHESMNTWSPRMSPSWKTLSLEHQAADNGRPNQTALYEKSPQDLHERQAAAVRAIDEALRKPLDTSSLATLIDLIRLSMNETAILNVLRKIRSELSFTPKESWYLVTWLVEHGDRDFVAANKEIQSLKKAVDRLHNISYAVKPHPLLGTVYPMQ